LAVLTFQTLKKPISLQVTKEQGEWLMEILKTVSIESKTLTTFGELTSNFEKAGLEDFDLFWYNKPMNTIYEVGLWVV
jgi:hypothetical protein